MTCSLAGTRCSCQAHRLTPERSRLRTVRCVRSRILREGGKARAAEKTTGMRNGFVSHWRVKASLSVALTLAFCLPYFALQHGVLFPVRQLPLSPIDNAIEFNPHWSWIYQSVYLLVSVVPWLADSVEDLRRYAHGFLLQAYVGFAVFLFLPVAGPRPSAATGDPMFELLLTYDS